MSRKSNNTARKRAKKKISQKGKTKLDADSTCKQAATDSIPSKRRSRSAPRSSGKKILAFKVALSFAALLLTLGLLELVFRSMDVSAKRVNTKYLNISKCLEFQKHPYHAGKKTLYKYKSNSIWATQYPNNPRGYFDKDNRIIYQLNSDGFRGRDFPEKRDSVYRVITIGDSCVLGEGVKHEDTFQQVMESLLRAEGYEVEVFNLGINGHDILDQSAFLPSFLSQYNPDLVIWGFTLNDISNQAFQQWPKSLQEMKKRVVHETPSYLLNFVQEKLWNRYYSRKFNKFKNEIYVSGDYATRLYAHLRKAKELIQANGAKHITILFPSIGALKKRNYPSQPIHDELHSFFTEEEVSFIDFKDIFKNAEGQDLRVHEFDGHPNEVAHRLIGEELFGVLGRDQEVAKFLQQREAKPSGEDAPN